MTTSRIISIILLVGGIICLGMAYQQSESFGDSAKHFFTGKYRDNTMWMIILGGLAAVLGLVGLFVPFGRTASAR